MGKRERKTLNSKKKRCKGGKKDRRLVGWRGNLGEKKVTLGAKHG